MICFCFFLTFIRSLSFVVETVPTTCCANNLAGYCGADDAELPISNFFCEFLTEATRKCHLHDFNFNGGSDILSHNQSSHAEKVAVIYPAPTIAITKVPHLFRYCQALKYLGLFHKKKHIVEGEGSLDAFSFEACMYSFLAKKFAEVFLNNSKRPLQICEIGFNLGYSAAMWLNAFPAGGATKLLSFDLGDHHYVKSTAQYFLKVYGAEFFQYVLGDSAKTVPKFASENPNFHCDIISIDGGHEFAPAASDVCNMRALVKSNLPHVVVF